MIGTPSLIILVNKSRGMGLVGHAACREEEERFIQGFGGET
jgi:hypothetical protein